MQNYYAFEIEIEFGLYYRPQKIAYLKSSDGGKTFVPWHYYVSYYINNKPTVNEQCQTFGVEYNRRPASANSVLCMTFAKATIDTAVWNETVRLIIIIKFKDIQWRDSNPV